jgi:hypothetical protein
MKCNLLFIGTQARAYILNMIAHATAENYVPIWLSLDFAISRWCDWTYVVDLDQNTFEVFGGQEHKQKASTPRFNDVSGDDDTVPALLQRFSFSQLPATEEEFMCALEAGIKEKGRAIWTYKYF